jgi:aspartate aminotransferase
MIAKRVRDAIERSSWIRKMFEEGARLKGELGAENVFDFSLGNPNLPPPEKFYEVLAKIAAERTPGIHGYMPNAGFPAVREAVAGRVAREQNSPVIADNILMSVGAGGGLNAVFRTLLDPGDEILVPAPFFVEYGFYAENHNGVLKTAATTEDFDLDIEAIAGEINEKTRIVLVNTPNNPTGRVYDIDKLSALGELLTQKSKEFGRTIYLVSDEPYRAIAYDVEVPPVFPAYTASIICYSFSKDLSMAGERIGYIAINPAFEGRDLLSGSITLSLRVLGFVNAPAIAQRLVAELLDETVDIEYYRANRDALYNGLIDAGYECRKPEGAFYLFPKSPIEDDVEFCRELQKEGILAVPGSGFFGPGHFRLAYCCSHDTVERSLPGFKKAIERVRG